MDNGRLCRTSAPRNPSRPPPRQKGRSQHEGPAKCRANATKKQGNAQDMAVDAFDDAHTAIKGNPLTAVAIALGIGFLFGVVAGSRR